MPATITYPMGQISSYNYDGLRRLSSISNGIYTKTYGYRDISDTQTTTQVQTLAYTGLEVPLTYTYTYDALGNISTISDPLVGSRSYTYDNQGQMLTETIGNTTYTYTYDTVGNILTANNLTGSHTYTYGNVEWRDLLTAYDGVEFEYDDAGNPLTYYNGTNWTFTWGKQKRLETATSGGNTINFYYTEDGMRNLKYANGVNYHYIYNGGKLMRMYTDDVTMDFIYDAQGQPFAMIHNGRILYYVLNLQGDVVRLVDSDGESFGVYRYDAWGNIIYASDNQWINDNPLRYRGYVYDTETKLYYCQSRYYDPAIGRFLNADDYSSTGQGILGHNMFAYCGNNPVCMADYSGNIPTIAIPIWDYWIIHKMVQERIAYQYGYAMEVYVKKDDGKRGYLDLYDAEYNQYYEVKHETVAHSSHTRDQMKAYNSSTIKDWRFIFYTFDGSPKEGTNAAINGSFNYGIYTISYSFHAAGLITYQINVNPYAVAAAAVVIASSLLRWSSEYSGPMRHGQTQPAASQY